MKKLNDFPRHLSLIYNLPIPSRIHCQAWQRGGIGAMCGEETQDLTHRACGKWSPSGDTGEAAGYRTSPVASRLERRVGRACAAHKGAGSGGCVGIVRRDVAFPGRVRGALSSTITSKVRASRTQNGKKRIAETGGQHPPDPAFAEGPESRAKTAERGAGRCHFTFFQMRHHRRPVRNAL